MSDRKWTALQATAFFWITAYAEAANLRPLLNAIRHAETGGQADPTNAVGDGGKSIGPYQIGRAYWQDARVGFGNYRDVRDQRYSEAVMIAYWRRYCPRALARGDWRTLAKVHNGGPAGHRLASTRAYWAKVKAILQKRKRS
jgi:hypothetical protein